MKKPVMLPVEATIHPGGLAARALEDPIGRFPKEKITSMCTHAHLRAHTHITHLPLLAGNPQHIRIDYRHERVSAKAPGLSAML